MITRQQVLQKLPPYLGKKVLVVEEQSTKDIISEMISAHKDFADDYDRISSLFWKGNQAATAKYIFDFLKKNVKYSIEPDHRQSVKSPAAIVATGAYSDGHNDCKHYSLFISGVLDSLRRHGYPVNWRYRFANYRERGAEPGHVFTVVKNKGSEVWVDPVLPSFNYKKSYISAIDKKVDMSLYKISGVGSGVVNVEYNGRVIAGVGIGKLTKAQRKSNRAAKPKKHIFLKITGAIARNAFLALVGLNVRKLAETLAAHARQDETKLKNKWENLGGNYKKLKNTINHALLKKHLPTLGVIQLAAALAAAAPILAALKEFLGGLKGEGNDGGIIQESQNAVEQVHQEVIDNPGSNPNVKVRAVVDQTLDEIPVQRARVTANRNDSENSLNIQASPPAGMNKFIIPAAILGGALLLTRRN